MIRGKAIQSELTGPLMIRAMERNHQDEPQRLGIRVLTMQTDVLR